MKIVPVRKLPKHIFLLSLITALQIIFNPQNTVSVIQGKSESLESRVIAGNNKPNIKSQEIYYQISGTTAQELRQQMNQKGPGNYDGYTQWHVKWNYRYQQRNKYFPRRCQLRIFCFSILSLKQVSVSG